MQIVCPNCAAAYQVPDELLARRKSVRCARCGESWVPEVLPAEGEPGPEAACEAPLPALRQAVSIPEGLNTEVESYDSLAEREPMHLPTWTAPPSGLNAAWVASIAVVLLGLVLLFADHRAFAAGWPPLQRLYGLFGLR